jgi:hypothetical protein
MAFPKSAPQDEATSELVRHLRETVLPGLAVETGATYLVGDRRRGRRLRRCGEQPVAIFVLVVVGLSALLLLTVFRSVLIPLKAAVLNLLSIGASLGCHHAGLPTGLVRRAGRTDRGVRPGDDLRDRVRPSRWTTRCSWCPGSTRDGGRTGEAGAAVCGRGLPTPDSVITAAAAHHDRGVRRLPAEPGADAAARSASASRSPCCSTRW